MKLPETRIPWFEPEFQRDPYPLLAALRERTPVFLDLELDHVVVTRYGDIEDMLLDRDTFAAANASSPLFPPCPEAQEVLRAEGYKRVPTLNNADPPRHAPMRKAVFSCMSRRRLRALESEVRSHARRLVEQAVAKRSTDLVADLAHPLPAHAALCLIGVPDAEIEQIKRWGDKRVLLTYGRLRPEEQIEVAKNVGAYWRYCEELVAAREHERRDDLTSDLLGYRAENPQAITHDDIVNMIYSMSLAGHESTTNAIAGGLRHLLAARDQWRALAAEPALIPNAVEECLRFDSPVLGHRRIATCATEIGGVAISKGARLVMLFGAAHRDPAQFPDPDRFDVRRAEANTHLAFGRGVHFCLGAPLARLEMQAALELLVELAPELRLESERPLRYAGNALWRTLTELWAAPN